MDVAAPLARARGLELRREFDQDLPEVLIGDAERLRKVLMNLLSNAVKFLEQGSASALGRSYPHLLPRSDPGRL
jgi:signal transduction histidine kinase